MAPFPGVPPDIALIQGPILLGALFSYGLLGILVAQIYMYSTTFPKDRLWIKILVWVVFVVELLSAGITTDAVWYSLAAGWGDPETLVKTGWAITALPPISGFIACAVQLFYCWRIFKLSESRILPIFIVLVSLLQWAMSCYAGIKLSLLGSFSKIGQTDPEVTVWLAGSATCDLLITLTMVRLLVGANTSSFWRETQSMINKLILLTVETGMVTALAASLELIFFWVFRNNNMHFLPFLMLGKLYSNTLLAMLNARAGFNSSQTHGIQSSDRSISLWGDSRNALSTARTTRNVQSGIRITTTTTAEERGADVQMVVLEGDRKTDAVSDGKGSPTL